MGAAAHGGRGFKGRAEVSGERPIGAASRRQQHNQVSCQPPPPFPVAFPTSGVITSSIVSSIDLLYCTALYCTLLCYGLLSFTVLYYRYVHTVLYCTAL